MLDGKLSSVDAILDALPANIALLDHRGVIIAVNAGWRAYADQHGLSDPNYGVGTNYLQICGAGMVGEPAPTSGSYSTAADAPEALEASDTPVSLDSLESPDSSEAEIASVDLRAIGEGLQAVLNGEKSSFSFEYPCHGPTEKRWYRFTATPRPDGGAIVMHVDITDRQMARQILQESDARFQNLVRGVKDYVIVMLDPDGRIMSWNAGAISVNGYEEWEVLGRSYEIFFPQEDREAGLPASLLRKAVADGRVAHEGMRLRKDGSAFWADSHLTALWTETGDLQGFAKVVRDVTARRLAADSLRQSRNLAEQANRAKDQFLATVSHEIRTPMSGVLGMLDVLLEGKLEERQHYLAETARDSAAVLVRLLDDLLDIESIEAGRLTLSPHSFSIRETISEVVRVMAARTAARQVALTADVAQDLPEVLFADERRLKQILTNLLSNAVKFTDTGGIRVTCSVSTQTDSGIIAKIDVSDTGIGIPPHAHHLIFKRYGQVVAPETGGRRGAGLGLMISKQIAERMGGDISFTSQPGAGSTFTVTMPLQIGDESHGTATVEHILSPSPGFRVLVADDDVINQQVSMAILKNMGHSVVLADDGRAACEIAQHSHFDLIILDLHMPVMDGADAARRILSGSGPNSDAVILALTADATARTAENAYDAGVADVLNKPIRQTKIASTIERHRPSIEARMKPRTKAGADAAGGVTSADLMIPGSDSTDEILNKVVVTELQQAVGVSEYLSLVSRFIDRASTDQDAIERAIADGDFSVVQHLSHTLAGTAANLGAREVNELMQDIVRCSASQDSETAISLLRRVPDALNRLASSVEQS